MLWCAVGRQPVRVGGEKRERRLRILAVLGEVEVHAPHRVPRRVEASQRLLDRCLRCGEVRAEGCTERRPETAQHIRRQVLRARHRRSGGDDVIEVGLGRWGRFGGGGLSGGRRHARVRLGAERCHEPCGEVAPVGERRRERGDNLACAKLQEPVARPGLEGPAETLGHVAVQHRHAFGLDDHQVPARRQDEVERGVAGRSVASHRWILPRGPR